MSEETRRWGDRAWDVAMKVVGVLLMVVCSYFFVRLGQAETKIQHLEVRAAVNDTEKTQMFVTLGEIKADVKSIKAKVGVP